MQFSFTALMQRIFNHDKTQNITVTPDKVLNISIYASPFCVIMYTNYKLVKTVQIFGPPCIILP